MVIRLYVALAVASAGFFAICAALSTSVIYDTEVDRLKHTERPCPVAFYSIRVASVDDIAEVSYYEGGSGSLLHLRSDRLQGIAPVRLIESVDSASSKINAALAQCNASSRK